jgi:hypothetical protein
MANLAISNLTDAGALTGDELLEVSIPSATINITATTISAAASDNSYNDSANGFGTAGFAVGDRVRVQGFTGNAANNIFTGIITALTTAKMTIGGTDGDVIVDDAAGESVTITKWETHRTTAQDIADLGGGGGGANVSHGPFDSLAIASGAIDLDLDAFGLFEVVLTANVTTVTLSNLTNGDANFFTLRVAQDATGSRTWANPASWKFPGGVAYTVSSAANKVDLLQGISYDDGTTWLVTFAKDIS